MRKDAGPHGPGMGPWHPRQQFRTGILINLGKFHSKIGYIFFFVFSVLNQKSNDNRKQCRREMVFVF